MNPLSSPYVFIMIAAAMICIFIAVSVWPYRRDNSETIPLTLLLLGIIEWITAALLGLLDQDLSHKILWAKFEYIGVVSVPLALLGYVLHHSGSKQYLTGKRLALLALIPVVTLILAWTNEKHGLIWARYVPYLENGLVFSEKTYGPGFWVYWVYSYLILTTATVLTLRLTLVSARIFRWQSTLVAIGILMPWMGNLIYVLHLFPLRNLDLTPLAFSITGIMLATGMFRWHLFDIKPIAQAAVIAGMADGLMILDNQGRIVEVNPAAKAILGLNTQEVVGKQMEQIITDRLPPGERSYQLGGKTIELQLTSARGIRDYELSDSPFYEKNSSLGGRIIFLHDVTDRKRLEGSLKEAERKHAKLLLQQAENKYKTLYQNMPVGVIYQSVDGKVIDINPAAERILGVGLDQMCDLASIRANLRTVHEDGSDFPAEEHPGMVSLKTGKPLQNQLIGVYFPIEKDYHWINIDTLPQFMPGEDAPYQVVVTLEDITERKRANEALTESYRLLQTIINTTPVRIFWKDQELRYLGCNPAFATDAGEAHPDDLIGKDDYQLGWKAQAELYRADDRQVMRSGIPKISYDEPQVTPDGRLIWLRTSKVPLRDKENQIIGVLGVYEDITERKRAEEALRTSESQLSNAVKIARLGHWEYDVAGDRFTFNDNFYAMLRTTVEQVGGYTMSSAEYARRFVYPDEIALVGQEIQKAIEATDPHFARQLEHRIIYGDGEIGYIAVRFFIVKDSQGHTVKTYGVNQDITERKRSEETLRESELRFRTLIEQAPVAISVSRDGIGLYTNRKFVQTFGLRSIEESVGKPNFEYFAPQFQAASKERAKRRSLGLTVPDEFESIALHADGTQFPIQVNIAQVKLSDGIANIAFVNDITERKQAELEIQHQNEDLLLINVLNDAVNRGEALEEIIEVFAREARTAFSSQYVTLYLLSPDAKYIEMQSTTLSRELTGRVQKLIGRPIPKVKILLKEGSFFSEVLANEEGTIASDPKAIQRWIEEFAETTFLPPILHATILKIVPKIYKTLNIHCILIIPLTSAGQAIGLMDMSSNGEFTQDDLRRIRTISRQLTAVIKRKQAEEKVQLHLQRMSALSEIDRTITSSLDIRLSLEVLLGKVLSQLGVDAASVLLLNASTHSLDYIAGKGFHTPAVQQSQMSLREGLARQVMLDHKVVHITDFSTASNQSQRLELLRDEKFEEYLGIPLIAKGMFKGVLEIFHRSPLNPDQQWMNYLETLGGQAAIAIDNAQLFEGMQRSNQELISAYDATIEGWSHALDLRDKETEGHSQRVTELTLKLAEEIGIRPQELVNIRRGALLHDIGKLGIPDRILLKPGPLSEDEWDLMRQHPQFSYDMLAPITYLRPALDIPYCHHEKWDGTGYPRGLKGEQIPLSARLFAVVDVWDALRSDRPYRKAWSEDKVIEHIKAGSGTYFDPKVVELLLRVIGERKEGHNSAD